MASSGHSAYRKFNLHGSNKELTDQEQARPSIGNQDYFNYEPVTDNCKKQPLNRLQIPSPLQLYHDDSSPLLAGPVGYRYTPLCLRTPDLESLRYDHGVEFKGQLSIKKIILSAQWHLLLDEEALPSRIKHDSLQSLKKLKKNVWHKIVRWGQSRSMFLSRLGKEDGASQS
jgi:hypothetical protein